MDEEWRWCEDGEVIPGKCHRICKMYIWINQPGSLKNPKYFGMSGFLQRGRGIEEWQSQQEPENDYISMCKTTAQVFTLHLV